ncbi:MAG: PrgI family protein [Clostridia bacterium]|nr:PrgI family protein [Clostridia bacterium]
MEVKINKEIRQYTESIFFGLSLRQFICSILACATAVIIYFVAKQFLDVGIVSWLCMAGAIPFVLLGFVKYNGMTAENFFKAWIKSEILTPKKLVFKPTNYYYETYKEMQKNRKFDNKKSRRKKRKEKLKKLIKFKKNKKK